MGVYAHTAHHTIAGEHIGTQGNISLHLYHTCIPNSDELSKIHAADTTVQLYTTVFAH